VESLQVDALFDQPDLVVRKLRSGTASNQRHSSLRQLEETVTSLMREVEPCRQTTGDHSQHQQIRVLATRR
jgi:hypothetical protein